MPKLLLTPSRRARIVEIMRPLGWGVSVDTKAGLIVRQLGEPCTHGQALSLLAQFRKGRGRRQSAQRLDEINQARFEQMRDARGDLY